MFRKCLDTNPYTHSAEPIKVILAMHRVKIKAQKAYDRSSNLAHQRGQPDKKRLELCVLNWPASHAKNTCYPSTGCEKFRPSQVKRSLQCLPPRGRLFVSSIIKQIGRENTISAENYVCTFLFCVFQRAIRESPLQNTNILMRTSLMRDRLFAL